MTEAPVYDFQEQLGRGQMFEARIKRFLEEELSMVVTETEMDLQRLGIDFLVTSPRGTTMSVEVKSDERAQDTGNAFIETVSVERSDGTVEKLGWIHTTLAQVLVYYIPKLGDIYICDMAELKRKNGNWQSKYSEKVIRNKSYVGRGYTLPLYDLRDYAWIRKVEPYVG